MDASVAVKAAETAEMHEEHVSGPGRERFCIACVSGRGPILLSPRARAALPPGHNVEGCAGQRG